MIKEEAILFGPFIGELWWEIYNFCGFFNFKRNKENCKFIVLTRPQRFDLYGCVCDVLVPLKISNERDFTQDCFTLKGIDQNYYESIAKNYRSFYEKKFKIKNHYYPDIGIRYNLKWQFPRRERIYDFKPRMANRDLVKRIVNYSRQNLVVTDIHDLFEVSDHETINISNFLYEVNRLGKDHSSVTELGCLIELIKLCRFFIGNLQSITTKIALLLDKPIIAYNETYEDDYIYLLNKKAKVFKCNNIQQGIIMYEDSIRFAKNRSGK